MTTPFARGSVSFRLYPHGLDAVAMVEELRAQAALAVASGFDGVMISERHGGIVGNMPNPIQTAGWLAEAMATGWVAPCPVLIPLRPAAQVVEELAWLGARFPGRVGIGLGAGGHDLDYELYGTGRDNLAVRFGVSLELITAALSGRATGPLSGDAAVRRCARHPVPVLSAALSRTAARRAARCGAGFIGSSLLSVEQEAELSAAYANAGGTGPRVLIRHVWLGDPPLDAIAAKVGEYRATAVATGRSFGGNEVIAGHDPSEIAERVAAAARDGDKTCVNLRVHVPGVAPAQAREQIAAVGEQVVPLLRAALVSAATR
jgi:alkanesulfonate monooxygenase SsuD/methylene tetrahydromethanopterin reductase-like flavin-dependent oxidoreductase (luciferase family)